MLRAYQGSDCADTKQSAAVSHLLDLVIGLEPVRAVDLSVLKTCAPVSCRHRQLLFQLQGCLRFDQTGCLPQDNPFYAVSHYGVDPMAQRLSKESELLSLEHAADINPYPTAERCIGAHEPLHKCRWVLQA